MGQALLGVIGWPIGHSASPVMMNSAFAHDGLDAVYIPFSVQPDRVKTALDGLKALGAHGANITIPHKKSAYEWVESLTDEARAVGAVNTIRFDPERGPIGHNTDVSGWWASIEPFLPETLTDVTVLGAGGAALAILAAFTLYRPGVRVRVVARRSPNRTQLQEKFQENIDLQLMDWDGREQAIEKSQLVVNATPIGMWPNVDESPVDSKDIFQPGHIVQDIIYRPLMTKFMSQASEQGATVVGGLSMLVQQGIRAYEWWFGRQAPGDVMHTAAERFVAENRLSK